IMICDELMKPSRLWTKAEVLLKPSSVPKAPGVYAWFFRDLDAFIPSANCYAVGEFRLLYVGISPSAPPQNGKLPSTQALFHRSRYHMNGNAEDRRCVSLSAASSRLSS